MLLSKFPFCLSAMCVTPPPSPPASLQWLEFWVNLPPTDGNGDRRSLLLNWCTDVFSLIWNHHFTPTSLVRHSSFVCLAPAPPLPPPCLCFFCNAFLVPKFCHCKELSTMPIIMIMIIINYELLYLQSLYKQSILSMFHVRPSERSQFSLCISCCLRFKKNKKSIARFLQKCLFLYENKRFCSTLYHGSSSPVDQTCSGRKKTNSWDAVGQRQASEHCRPALFLTHPRRGANCTRVSATSWKRRFCIVSGLPSKDEKRKCLQVATFQRRKPAQVASVLLKKHRIKCSSCQSWSRGSDEIDFVRLPFSVDSFWGHHMILISKWKLQSCCVSVLSLPTSSMKKIKLCSYDWSTAISNNWVGEQDCISWIYFISVFGNLLIKLEWTNQVWFFWNLAQTDMV